MGNACACNCNGPVKINNEQECVTNVLKHNEPCKDITNPNVEV